MLCSLAYFLRPPSIQASTVLRELLPFPLAWSGGARTYLDRKPGGSLCGAPLKGDRRPYKGYIRPYCWDGRWDFLWAPILKVVCNSVLTMLLGFRIRAQTRGTRGSTFDRDFFGD